MGTAMRGRTKRHARGVQRTTRRLGAPNRTTTHTQAGARPLTLGDVTNHDPKLARLMFTAFVLGKHARCDPIRAKTHAAELHKKYGLTMDDALLQLAVATGWGLLQDEPRRRQVAAMVEWNKRLWSDIPNDGIFQARLVLNELRPGLAAVTAAVASAAEQGPPLGRDGRYVATAVTAAAVATVLRGLTGRPRDWQMTARVLEYYGWDLGTESLRRKGDAHRHLVGRRTLLGI
jgi:hypothetical protein